MKKTYRWMLLVGWLIVCLLYYLEEAPSGQRMTWMLIWIAAVTLLYAVRLGRQVPPRALYPLVAVGTILIELQSARLLSPTAHLLHLYNLGAFAADEGPVERRLPLVLLTLAALAKFPIAWFYGVPMAPGEMMVFYGLLQLLLTLGILLLERYRAEKATVAALYARLRSEVVRRDRLTLAKERERMSRSLHDTLGHRLTEVLMRLEMSTVADDQVIQAKATLREGLAELQAVVRDLHRIEPVDRMLDRLRAMGYEGHLVVEGDERFLHCTPVKTVVREGITNFLKHSSGQHLEIRLVEKDTVVHLTVADDGHVETPFEPGRGLAGMRSWVEEIGGAMTVQANRGFTLEVLLNKEVCGDETGDSR